MAATFLQFRCSTSEGHSWIAVDRSWGRFKSAKWLEVWERPSGWSREHYWAGTPTSHATQLMTSHGTDDRTNESSDPGIIFCQFYISSKITQFWGQLAMVYISFTTPDLKSRTSGNEIIIDNHKYLLITLLLIKLLNIYLVTYCLCTISKPSLKCPIIL